MRKNCNITDNEIPIFTTTKTNVQEIDEEGKTRKKLCEIRNYCRKSLRQLNIGQLQTFLKFGENTD